MLKFCNKKLCEFLSRETLSYKSRNASSLAEIQKLNPFFDICKNFEASDGKKFQFFDLKLLNDERFYELPFSIRILLESAIRNAYKRTLIKESDVESILNWRKTSKMQKEISFIPARVLLQDFTGVPALVDLASMRDCIARHMIDPSKINPLVPVDLVVDHSIQVDYFKSGDSRMKNEAVEFSRNSERFSFLKWGSKAFNNLSIIPPGSGIVHQVNLEYLSRVAFVDEKMGNTIYPDSLVGTDSHTTMINGMGIVGWGVGGIEAEAVMLSQPISMILPEVLGFRFKNKLSSYCTATDLVLTVTQILRQKKVVGKFVEFFGEGVKHLCLADRATVANMSPEYGATMGYFPLDERTLQYLLQTGRSKTQVGLIEKYYKKAEMFASKNSWEQIRYSEVIELDLSEVEPSLAGPKRPQDRVTVKNLKSDFIKSITAPIGFKGYGQTIESANAKCSFMYKGKEYELRNGSIIIGAITSCTNTSNPSVMLGAALLAKKACEKNLSVPEYIKTSLSPGSKAVSEYLRLSGLTKYLENLGFFLAGYGCMTCIGNSGELDNEVAEVVHKNPNLVLAAILSGNRNFEGRVHPLTRANYLASPPLVIAYCLAGRININFDSEPIGYDQQNNPVFLRDIWPSAEEIESLENKYVKGSMFVDIYNKVKEGTEAWNGLKVADSKQFPWNENSTYIHNPPFFKDTTEKVKSIGDIVDAVCLLNLGDSITTDHISPAGNIHKASPAAQYLLGKNVQKNDFNTYGCRRGNDEVMLRGTFANIRLINKMCRDAGPKTKNFLDGSIDYVCNVAEKYRNEKIQMIILAGKEYGTGSSRDWAAKGTALLGVSAIIAESFERIHRSNLIGMGVLPLQFVNGQNAETLKLEGDEKFTFRLKGGNLSPEEIIKVEVKRSDGTRTSFDTKCRIDTDLEAEYYKNGGILQYVLRKLIVENKKNKV